MDSQAVHQRSRNAILQRGHHRWTENDGRPFFEIGQRDTRDQFTVFYNEGEMVYHPFRSIVSVQVDTNPPFRFEMTSDGYPDTLGVELRNPPAQFVEQLMTGRKMDITKGGQTRTFSLAGSHRALSMMAACIFNSWEDWKRRGGIDEEISQ